MSVRRNNDYVADGGTASVDWTRDIARDRLVRNRKNGSMQVAYFDNHRGETMTVDDPRWVLDSVGSIYPPSGIALDKPSSSHQKRGSLGEIDAGDDDELWGHIEPRGWLLGNVFCREFLSSLFGDGGVGKTALRIAQLLSLATGRELTGEHVFQRCRVLLVSFEDSKRELMRRIRAACIYHNIAREELKGWLFYVSLGASAGKLMTLDGRKVVRGELGAKLEQAVTERSVDIIHIDPFVKAHGVDENSNVAIDEVAQVLTDLTAKYNIAADTPHHVSKGQDDPGNANRGRGATALKDAARLVYTLTPMSSEEAEQLGVSEAERCRLIRMDRGKVNIVPRAGDAKWFRLVGVHLGNGNEKYPNGDEVQTVEPWLPPSVWKDFSVEVINMVLDDIQAANGKLSAHPNATNRAAWPLIISHAPHKTEKQAKEIVKAWLKTGLLYQDNYRDEERCETVKGLYVNNGKRPQKIYPE